MPKKKISIYDELLKYGDFFVRFEFTRPYLMDDKEAELLDFIFNLYDYKGLDKTRRIKLAGGFMNEFYPNVEGWSPQTVRKYLKKLVDDNVLVPAGNDGHGKYYMLNLETLNQMLEGYFGEKVSGTKDQSQLYDVPLRVVRNTTESGTKYNHISKSYIKSNSISEAISEPKEVPPKYDFLENHDSDNYRFQDHVISKGWVSALEDKYNESEIHDKLKTLVKYLTKYPDQKKWIMGRDLKAFLEGINEAERVMYKPEKKQQSRDYSEISNWLRKNTSTK